VRGKPRVDRSRADSLGHVGRHGSARTACWLRTASQLRFACRIMGAGGALHLNVCGRSPPNIRLPAQQRP
jgi:hypothetical protein